MLRSFLSWGRMEATMRQTGICSLRLMFWPTTVQPGVVKTLFCICVVCFLPLLGGGLLECDLLVIDGPVCLQGEICHDV